MYTAIQSAIAVDFTLYKIKLLLLLLFQVVELQAIIGMSTIVTMIVRELLNGC